MTTKRPFVRRKTAIIIGAVFILAIASVGSILGQSEAKPQRHAPRHDYTALLKILPDNATLRHPTTEELKVFPVIWPTVPVEDNAAYYYAQAVSLKNPGYGPPGSLESLDIYTGDLAALDTWIASNRAALEMVITAQMHPACRFPVFVVLESQAPSPLLSLLSELRSLGRRSVEVGFVEEAKGRPDVAAHWYLLAIKMGAQIRQGVTIQSMIGHATLSLGTEPLEQLIARSQLSDKTLRDIIQVTHMAETRPGEIADSLQCEAEYTEAERRLVGITGDALDKLDGTSRAIRAARKDEYLPVFEVLKSADAQEAARHGVESDNPLAAFWQWRGDLGRMDAHLRAIQIRAAITLYQRRHDKLPDTLEALCPEFLPRVPLDPFSGKPIRYGQTPEGWKVWGAGYDLVDNGGEVESGQEIGWFWRGKDFVFVSRLPSSLERARDRLEPGADAGQTPPTPSSDKDILGLMQLHRAANLGDIVAVMALLNKGADANARSLAKQTPLHLVRDKDVAELLIANGAEVEARDYRGRTPLFYAAGTGRKDVVEVLLAHGARANAPETIDPHDAQFFAFAKSQLPEKYAEALPTGSEIRTPITFAEECGHPDIAEMLRKHLAERQEGK